MNGRDAVGLAAIAAGYAALIAGCTWLCRREKKRIRADKASGRLPVRRSPPRPSVPANRAFTVTVVAIWAFVPIIVWAFTAFVVPKLTPPSARVYLAPVPPFLQALWWNVGWWLFWVALVLLIVIGVRLENWLRHRFTDPAVSRARALIEVGSVDAAVLELREAIDAHGLSLARWDALADALIAQEEWAVALKVSLEFEDRWWSVFLHRRRIALALCHLGRPDAGISQVAPSGEKGQRLRDACSYCHALIDLELFDPAWNQLRRVEAMYGEARSQLRGEKTLLIREQIDACRARLAGRFADKKPNDLAEL